MLIFINNCYHRVSIESNHKIKTQMAKSTFKSQNLNSNLEIDNLIAISNILPSTMIDRFCKRIAKSIIQSQNLLSNF